MHQIALTQEQELKLAFLHLNRSKFRTGKQFVESVN
jgi:hypothetical protein